MFDGRNITSGLPDELVKVVDFLNEKASAGEFEFSDSVSYWENNEHIINPSDYSMSGGYFAVALAYIAHLKSGNIIFEETNNIGRWAWAFHLVSGVSSWSPEFMKNVILSFESKQDNTENLILWAVQKYASAYYDNAVVLISILPQYKTSCLAGLMENDFDRYYAEYPPEDNMKEFATAFVKTNQIAEEYVNKAFDIVVSNTCFKSSAAMAFSLFTIGRLVGQRKEICEQKILEMLQGDPSPYINPLCNWLFVQQGVSPFIEQSIILLVKGLKSENKETALKSIDDSIHFHFKDAVFLTNIFVAIANSLTPMDILKMEGSLRSLHENEDNFINFVLSFIFHPNGLYRVVGRRLWDDYHLESSNFDPQKDLDEKLQCLLIIELLQDYGNPETRLPKLLPLIESELPSVRNVLMSQLVPYLDEYMGYVIKAFEKLNIDNEFVTKIHWYFEKRSDAIDKRRSLKEMSPKYGYMIEYQEALKTQKQHWQQQMKKADENHKSLLSSMMKHVTLARGGGWRDENGKVQHLGCIQFSMPSRQLAQSMTPMEQDKWINDLLVDWNEKTGNN